MNRNRVMLILVLTVSMFLLVAGNPNPVTVGSQSFTGVNDVSESPMSLADDTWDLRYEEHGTTINNHNGSYTYSARLGETNIWNGTAYTPYIWNESLREVYYFQNHTIEFYDWFIRITNSTHTLVDDARWQVNYWSETGGGRWSFLDLYSHSWLEPIFNEENMTFGQHYEDGTGNWLNMKYTIANWDILKITAELHVVEANQYQLVWQLTGIQGEPTIVKSSENYTEGVEFGKVAVGWWDVAFNNGLNATFDWSVSNKKLDVQFSNFTVNADETYILDPSISDVEIGADSDDTEYQTDSGFTNNNAKSYNAVAEYYDNQRWHAMRWSLAIPEDSTFSLAKVEVYQQSQEAVTNNWINRMTEDNPASLEADTSVPSWTTTGRADIDLNTNGGWETSLTMITMMDTHIAQASWESGDYMGFIIDEPDGSSDGDTVRDVQSATGAEITLTWTEPNTAPVNDATPTCTNMDDTDNLYARYKLYEFSVSVTDTEGYADIDYLELSSYDTGTTTLRWRVRFDQDTHVFSEISGASYIGLDDGSSTYDESGVNLDVTFKLFIEWAHPDAGDDDLYQYVRDSYATSDSDAYNSNYDYETRLDLSTFGLSDGSGTIDRGNIAGSITASGTVIYFGSGNNYPASSQVDVWIHCADVSTSPWSDLTLVSGAFSKAVMSDDVEGLDTYSFKVVLEGTGAWATDQLHATHSDTYIADSLVVTLVEDTTTPLGGSAVNIDVTVTYEYDSSTVASWSMMVTRDSIDWLTKTADFADTNVKGTDYIYGCSTATDVGAHGVTAFTLTPSSEVIWQNNIPVNDVTPVCTNLDDTDNLYARYKLYEFTVSITDGDGFADIDYIELRLYDTGTTTLRWTVRYTQSTNAFVEQAGGSYIELTGSTHDKSGNSIDLIIKLYIEWAHGDWADDDLRQYVIDGSAVTDDDSYDSNYDFETRLAITGFNAQDEDGYDSDYWYRGGILEPVYGVGTLTYLGSSINPSGDDVDVWFACTDVAGSPWEDDTLTAGAFRATGEADDIVGLDTYTVKAVIEGAGSSGTDLITSGTQSDTFISDALEIWYYYTTSIHRGVNSPVELGVWIRYDYDEVAIWEEGLTVWLQENSSGTQDLQLFHEATSKWNNEVSKPTVVNYKYTMHTCEGGNWGIEHWTFSVTDWQQVTWDNARALAIQTENPTGRIDINADSWVQVQFDFEHIGYSWITGFLTYPTITGPDGTVTLNSYQSEGWWRGTCTSTTWNDFTFNTNTLNDWVDTDSVNSRIKGAYTEGTYWDQIRVVSYAFVTGDARINVDATVTVDVELHYDSDETDVVDGTVTVNGLGTTYQSLGKWRFSDSEATVMMNTYNNVQSTGNTYGLTVEDNTVTQNVIWDRVYAVSLDWTGESDVRQNTGYDVTFSYELHYDYDEADVLDGTIVINSISFTYTSGGIWTYQTTNGGSVGSVTFDSIVASGNEHGITLATTSGNDVTFIWDRIQVQSYSASDERDNINDDVTIDATLWYDYDNTLVTDGTVTINGYSASHQGSGVWRITRTSATVTSVTYNNVQCTGNTHGITTEDQNGQSQDVIWDQIRVVSYTFIAGDARINVDATTTMDVELHYDYDETDVVDGIITVNGFSTVYQSAGKWRFSDSESTVIQNTYDTVVCTGNAHGITVEDNTVTQNVIWDQIVVMSYTIVTPTGDDRINVDATVTIDVELHYDYDETDVTDGTVTVNGLSTTYQSAGKWRFTDSESTVIQNTYNAVACTGNTHGITLEDNTVTESVIWDRVLVYAYATSDARDNINDDVNIDFRVWYDYDDTNVLDGDFSLNGYDSGPLSEGWWRITRTSATVTMVNYNTVAVTGANAHGITVIDQNGQSQEIVWDQIEVYYNVISDTRTNINEQEWTGFRLRLKYDNHILNGTDGDTVYMNSSLSSYDNSVWTFYKNYNYATVGSRNFVVTSASEDTHGITAFDSASAVTYDTDIIWDRVELTLDSNLTWTVIAYNTTLSATGIFEYDSTAWSGTVTWVDQFPVESTTGTYYYGESSLSAITDPTYDVTVYTVGTEASVIFDDIDIVSGPSMDWVQSTVDSVYLLWGAPTTYKWHVNNTDWLQAGAVVHAYSNGSSPSAQAAVYSDSGDLAGLAIGAFDTNWYNVDLSVNVEVTINSQDYDWEIWSQVMSVDILHSIHIEDSGMNIQDNWITFYFHTNWGNSTFYIWDGDAIVGGSEEGWYQVAKPTSTGLHNFTILVNGTQGTITEGEQNKDFSVSDSWVWRNFKFTVNPVTLSITDLLIQQNNESLILSGWIHTPSLSMTWEAFENGSSIDTGGFDIVASGDYYAIYWEKFETGLLQNFTLTLTAGESSLSVHGYSFVIGGASYVNTYSSSSLIEGDSLTNIYEGDTTDTAFWFTMQTILLVLAIPVVMGIAYFAALSRKSKKKRGSDRVNDILRTPTIAGRNK